MLVCLPCQTPMVVTVCTVWIAQTKLEHPGEVAKCPRCGCTVTDVNRGIERYSEEAEPGVFVLDLKETP